MSSYSGYQRYNSPVKSKLAGLASLIGGIGATGAFGSAFQDFTTGAGQMKLGNQLAMQRDSQSSVNRISELGAAADIEKQQALEQAAREEELRKRLAQEKYQQDMLRGGRILDTTAQSRELNNSTVGPLMNPLAAPTNPLPTPNWGGVLSPGEQGLREELLYGQGPYLSTVPQQHANAAEQMNRRFDLGTMGEISRMTRPQSINTAQNSANAAEFASTIPNMPDSREALVKSSIAQMLQKGAYDLGPAQTRVAPQIGSDAPAISTGMIPESTVQQGALKFKDPKTGMEIRDDPKVTQGYKPARISVGRLNLSGQPDVTMPSSTVPSRSPAQRQGLVTPMPSFQQPDPSTAFKVGDNTTVPETKKFSRLSGIPEYKEQKTTLQGKRTTPQQEANKTSAKETEYKRIVEQLKNANTPNARGGRMSKQQYESLKAKAEKLAEELGL